MEHFKYIEVYSSVLFSPGPILNIKYWLLSISLQNHILQNKLHKPKHVFYAVEENLKNTFYLSYIYERYRESLVGPAHPGWSNIT